MFFTNAKKRLKDLSEKLDAASIRIAELEKENSVIQSILGSMVEGVIALDKDSRIVSVNPAIESVFDIKKKEAEGKFFLEAIRNNNIAEIIILVLNIKKVLSKEINLVWPVQKIFQVNATPIFEKGSISGCLLVIHDITEIRKLETIRRDFVANVSHELKTPLTSIKGFVETLLEGGIDDLENARHFLKIVQEHANRLDNLITDLLDLSSIESKPRELEIEDLRLKDMMDKVILGFKSQLKKKSIQVTNDLALGLALKANKDKMEQVFTNLIDNAIKFNKEGGFIKAYSHGLGDKIKITIEDSGSGISPKDIPRIFERFYRVDKARSRELGGTGLGLAIVKHIIELHGGNVGVESTEGLGSKFFFTLPK